MWIEAFQNRSDDALRELLAWADSVLADPEAPEYPSPPLYAGVYNRDEAARIKRAAEWVVSERSGPTT